MDIFTTQLTRVVPVPIKPANLKVKALLKEAGAGKLKEDLDHLENHDYYFGNKNSNNEEDESKESDESNNSEVDQVEPTNTTSKFADKEHLDSQHPDSESKGLTETEDGVKHLDLYV
jgi:hypothetical protein